MTLPTKRSVMAKTAQDNIMLIYGAPGTGKSTFANNLADRVLFISTDKGTRHLNAARVECMTWKAVARVLDELEEKDAPKYDVVVLDHLDDIANMAEDEACRKLGIDSLSEAGYGKGWRVYKKNLQSIVRRIMKLGCGLVMIAHEDLKPIRTRAIETTRTMPSLGKSAWNVIIPIVDLVIFCGFTRIKDPKTGKRKEIRTIQTQPTESIYAKDRTNRRVPDGVELLDGKAFINTFQSKESNHGEAKTRRGRRRNRSEGR